MSDFDQPINPQIADNLRRLPQFPAWVMSAVNVLSSAPNAVELIAAELNKEKRFLNRFLTLANSPFYAVTRRLTTAQAAVKELGTQKSQSLIALLAAEEIFPIDQSITVQRPYFWRQSLTTGAIARTLTVRTGEPLTEEEAFLAGVFLNIGQLTLETLSPKEYLPVLQKTAEEPTTELWMHEQIALGITHASISDMLLEHWTLPEQIRTPVLLHHSPAVASAAEKKAVHLLHFANHLSRLWLNPEDARRSLLNEETKTVLSIATSDRELLDELRPELTSAEEFVVELSNLRN